jgi:hypothetical protein
MPPFTLESGFGKILDMEILSWSRSLPLENCLRKGFGIPRDYSGLCSAGCRASVAPPCLPLVGGHFRGLTRCNRSLGTKVRSPRRGCACPKREPACYMGLAQVGESQNTADSHYMSTMSDSLGACEPVSVFFF